MSAGDELDDGSLLTILEEELDAAISFENDASADARRDAIDYYRGVIADLPAADGRSSQVSMDVADVVDDILPSLMRVFCGSSQVVKYHASTPDDVERARAATQYVNHVFFSEADGYNVIQSAFWDALVVGNGIIKVHWDKDQDSVTEEFSGLSAPQANLLAQSPGARIVKIEQSIDENGEAVFSGKVARPSGKCGLRLENVPPEDIFISSSATSFDDGRFIAHRTRSTRSDLLKAGIARDVVDSIGLLPDDNLTDRGEDSVDAVASAASHRPNDVLDVYEAYPLIDTDGDGIVERRKILFAGGAGARAILSNEPWNDDLPLVDVRAWLMPHRWRGQSIADKTMQIQRVKTALLRGYLDSIYGAVLPERVVIPSMLEDVNDVLRRKHGNVIRAKAPNAVQELVRPFTGDAALAGLQFMDQVMQRRTGVAPQSAALDPSALTPQTATAEQISHDASYARVEFLARNLANGGMRQLFQKILRLIVRNQDRPRMLLIDDKPVEFDPRAWAATWRASVAVGLGTGSKERDLAILKQIGMEQDKIIAEIGVVNPIVPVAKYIATRHMMIEAAGMDNPESFFTSITDEQFAEWQKANPPPPDPKAMEMQSKLELEREKAAGDLQIKREKIQSDHQLRLNEMQMEAQLKGAAIGIGFSGQASTNISRNG